MEISDAAGLRRALGGLRGRRRIGRRDWTSGRSRRSRRNRRSLDSLSRGPRPIASMAAIMYIVYIQAWLWHVPYSKNPKICLKRSVEVEGFDIAKASGL